MKAEHCDIHAPIAHTVQSGSGQPCLLTTIMRIRNIQHFNIYSHFHVARLNHSLKVYDEFIWNYKTTK